MFPRVFFLLFLRKPVPGPGQKASEAHTKHSTQSTKNPRARGRFFSKEWHPKRGLGSRPVAQSHANPSQKLNKETCQIDLGNLNLAQLYISSVVTGSSVDRIKDISIVGALMMSLPSCASHLRTLGRARDTAPSVCIMVSGPAIIVETPCRTTGKLNHLLCCLVNDP